LDSRWSFAELAIEAMYQRTREQMMAHGIMLTRDEFWRTPGQLVIFPHGYLQLMRAGVLDCGLRQQFAARADNLGLVKNGRK
jgi:hypothetical protein